jgi:hypothetical protein
MFSFSPWLVTEPWLLFLFRLSNRKFHLFPEAVNLATERHPAACLEMVAANSMQNKRWKMPLAKENTRGTDSAIIKTAPRFHHLANAYVIW